MNVLITIIVVIGAIYFLGWAFALLLPIIIGALAIAGLYAIGKAILGGK
jgi:hypothetical protein